MVKAFLTFLQFSALACLVALVAGCATNPNDLRAPSEPTCIYLDKPLASTGRYGMYNVEWTTRLERGPYWSEKVDEKGTFFRGPQGGISLRGADGQPFPGQPATTDGGFYLPNDPKEPVKIYRYFTTSEVPTQVPPESLTCSTLMYATDPGSQKISLMPFAAGGAVGGAAGGVIGKSIAGSNGMSYGQAAGAGAVGGALGGILVAAIINAGVGKIVDSLAIQEAAFLDKLRELAEKREHLKQVPSRLATNP